MNAIGRDSAAACLLLAALALVPGTVRAQAGYVHELVGNVQMHARNGNGSPVALKVGDTFLPGATFRTSSKGRMVIKFEDGQIAALQPNSTLRVTDYWYDPRNAWSSRSAVALTAGGARFVTGLIGSTNREALRLAAGAFNISLRGTDVMLLAEAAPKPTQAVAVNLGLIFAGSSHGSISVGRGQFTMMPTGSIPSAPAPVSAAPAAVQAAVNSLSAVSLPDNRPVVVGSAARAAAAEARAVEAAAAADANPGNKELRAAADAAQAEAARERRTAQNQSAIAYDTAIRAGYAPPAPVAFSQSQQTAAAATPPGLTLPNLGCTGSPC
jgi:hypothetical protein